MGSGGAHPEGQGDGKAASAAAAVADGAPRNAALLIEPGQHLLHGLRVARADIQLHLAGHRAHIGHKTLATQFQQQLGVE